MSDKPIAKQPMDLLEGFQPFSKEAKINVSLLINHYADNQVDYNIEFNKDLYPRGIPTNTVLQLLDYVTRLIIEQSTTAPKGDSNDEN